MLHPGSRWLLSYQGCFCICPMGVERESIWKAKYTCGKLLRSCPCPTVPWERGCSLSTLLLLLYSTLLLTCPWALSADREVGREALLPEHLLEGHWESGLSQAWPRCSFTGRSRTFAAGGFPLCRRCSEEGVLTTSQHT